MVIVSPLTGVVGPLPNPSGCKWLGSNPPIYFSHFLGHLEGGPNTTRSLGDNNDHHGLLTTYPSPGMILQVEPNDERHTNVAAGDCSTSSEYTPKV